STSGAAAGPAVCIDKTAGNAAAKTAMMTRRGRSTPTVRALGRTQLPGELNYRGIAEWGLSPKNTIEITRIGCRCFLAAADVAKALRAAAVGASDCRPVRFAGSRRAAIDRRGGGQRSTYTLPLPGC